ncbi:phosphatase PAP2 family protein [Achromobacter xylosoxidans]|uniref:phosphatase PAP2 family protein n=1 Tax=Alcaligenes xylosoxydans xylosoxydans TaxID=85698 RepID=UPI0006C6F6F2|nr:phosphatase PAP2 family protein [Achromobacter xylosoxidans]CUI85139.1 PAP2 (acid phosphatase) superfamily protein [Achromobacter xylosoxidans]
MSSLSPPAATRPTPAAYLATHVLGVTLFLACLAWWANASGWDLAIARALFNPALDDFPLHTNRWLELIGHRMVLALPIGIGLGAIAVAAASYRIPAWRSLRGPALALALTCMAGQLAITQLKHYTTLPRPYDLDTLGGYTPYPQSWWTWDRSKAGGALPSGHAGAGYSLLALYFAGWAVGRPGWRWWGLAVGIAAGLAFSAVRILQGAHFLSQTLWSAALMWLLAALFFWPVLHGTGGRPASVSIAQLSSRPGSHSENAGT